LLDYATMSGFIFDRLEADLNAHIEASKRDTASVNAIQNCRVSHPPLEVHLGAADHSSTHSMIKGRENDGRSSQVTEPSSSGYVHPEKQGHPENFRLDARTEDEQELSFLRVRLMLSSRAKKRYTPIQIPLHRLRFTVPQPLAETVQCLSHLPRTCIEARLSYLALSLFLLPELRPLEILPGKTINVEGATAVFEIEAIYGYVRGQIASTPCPECSASRLNDAVGPFPLCILPPIDAFGGACCNCWYGGKACRKHCRRHFTARKLETNL
jgi:hypothetical protein